MSIGVLFTLTVAGTAAYTYSSSNSRSAQASKSGEVAYSLAEAGIAHSLSVLHAALDPRTGNLLPTTTVALPGGTVTYSGVLDANYIWTITSIGKVVNPTGAGGGTVQRTLTRKAEVRGLMTGATVGAWGRIYHDNTSTCMTIDSVVLVGSVSSRGDMCLQNGARIEGTTSKVSVGDDVTLTTASTSSSTRSAGTGSGWTSSGNVNSSNNSDATYSISGSGTSANLNTSDFGFDAPVTGTVTGIRVRIERAAGSASRISDTDVLLLKNGTPAGNDKAAAGTWGTTDTTITYGGAGDLWGTTWAPGDFNKQTFGVRFKAQATSGAAVTAYVDHIDVTVYYSLPSSSIGQSAAAIANADIGDTCKLGTATAHKPCSSADNVFATEISMIPVDTVKPTIDLAYWYVHAKPGPNQYCTNGGSYPNGFDNDSTYNNSRQGSDAYEEVTPAGSSYTCQVKDGSNNLLGELSWNHVTHVLKIHGTIFLDGDFRFDDDGSLVNYQGRGIIYATGDLEFDELLCAGGNGTNNCITNGMHNWDPTQNMMVVLSGDDSEYDQGGTQTQYEPSGFQGIVYANDDCTIHENFHSSGPLICDQIILPSEPTGWPTYYTWPPLGTLVEGQMYGSAATSPDFQLVIGAQSG